MKYLVFIDCNNAETTKPLTEIDTGLNVVFDELKDAKKASEQINRSVDDIRYSRVVAV